MQDLHDSEAGGTLESQVPCMQGMMVSLYAAVSGMLWDPKTKCLLYTQQKRLHLSQDISAQCRTKQASPWRRAYML